MFAMGVIFGVVVTVILGMVGAALYEDGWKRGFAAGQREVE